MKPSTREFLTLLEALKEDVISPSIDDFYYLSKATLVKDETKFDRFDFAFAEYFKGVSELVDLKTAIRTNGCARSSRKYSRPRAREAQGARLERAHGDAQETPRRATGQASGRQQVDRHRGTSPFGAYGDNPAGIASGRDKAATVAPSKVWDERQFRDYDDNVDFNTATSKVALRRLGVASRARGAVDELDLPHAGRNRQERGHALDPDEARSGATPVKVLLLLDIGGSMDDHVEQVEAPFSAAKMEFKRLEHFTSKLSGDFGKTNRRRSTERTLTMDLLHKYGPTTV